MYRMCHHLCLLIMYILGECSGLSSYQVEVSINRTIEAVSNMTRNDPTLPRLDRRQILDILHNITTRNPEFERIEKMTKEIYQKALTSAFLRPFNSDDKRKTMFKTIPDSTEGDAIIELGKTEEIVFPPHPQNPSPFTETRTERREAAESSVVDTKVICNNKQGSNPSRPSSFLNKSAKSFNQEPERFMLDLSEMKSSTNNYYARENNNQDMEESGSNDEEVIVYGKGVMSKFPVKTHPTEPSVPRQNSPWKFIGHHMEGTQEEASHFLPTMPSMPVNVNSMFQVPKKNHLSSSSEEDEHPAPVYVTPTSSVALERKFYPATTIEREVHNVAPTGSGGFAISTNVITKVKPVDILESMGLVPQMQKQTEGGLDLDIKIIKDMLSSDSKLKNSVDKNSVNLRKLNHSLLEGFDDYQSDFENVEMEGNESTSIRNTVEVNNQSIEKGVNNMSPDVKLFFQRFGLPQPEKDKTTKIDKMPKTTTTKKPITTTSYLDSFTNFKRLPNSKIENREMKDFLAKFGLGVGDRNQKSIKSSATKEIPFTEASSYDIRKALENVGLLALVPTVGMKLTPSPETKPSSNPEKLHVFKPNEVTVNSEEQKQKIRKLLDTVKMVQDGRVQDVERVVTDLVQTTKSLKSGPDPVTFEEILELYKEDMKREVKRENTLAFNESVDSTTETKTTFDDLTTGIPDVHSSSSFQLSDLESSSTTQQSPSTFDLSETLNTNVESDTKMEPDNTAALEDSFGGSTETPDPKLPTRPKSGLYFLVDWNSFLEVGEDKDKVNLRFQPKVGERSRFLPVTVP